MNPLSRFPALLPMAIIDPACKPVFPHTATLTFLPCFTNNSTNSAAVPAAAPADTHPSDPMVRVASSGSGSSTHERQPP